MTTSAESKPAKPLSTAERLEQKRQQEPKTKKKPKQEFTFLENSRGLLDALVFAFMLAMFIRSFVFELFMIPTGSMTPTLIGDSAGDVAVLDYDEDGIDDYLYTFVVPTSSGLRLNDSVQVYLMDKDGTYKDQIFIDGVDRRTILSLRGESTRRTDMIIVNKFWYWFFEPERADIAVFKVPHRPNEGISYEHDKPVYIKRIAALEGETITFPPAQISSYPPGHPQRYGNRFGGREIHILEREMIIDGEVLDHPRFNQLIHYPRPRSSRYPTPGDSANTWAVPREAVLMAGDNSASSSDGRYWGHVPENQLRGKAVLRYWPIGAFGFLK